MIDIDDPETISEARDQQGAEPAPADRAAHLAELIRKFTGVREELLARIPAERTRYTALAAVMACTASIGGLSMFFALSEILGSPEPWFGFLAAFWATFILCIDCWLVSSTAGTRWRTRVAVLLPRLAIAAVFGVVIAEPVILRVFQTGIVSHVQQERQAAIDTLRSALVDCNPVPGLPKTTVHRNCAGMILSISSPAAASQARLTALQSQATALQAHVSTETAQLSRKQNIVNEECNGTSGRGLTGIPATGQPASRTSVMSPCTSHRTLWERRKTSWLRSTDRLSRSRQAWQVSRHVTVPQSRRRSPLACSGKLRPTLPSAWRSASSR